MGSKDEGKGVFASPPKDSLLGLRQHASSVPPHTASRSLSNPFLPAYFSFLYMVGFVPAFPWVHRRKSLYKVGASM